MAKDYSSERSRPTVPTCGRSSLVLKFDGSSLVLKGQAKFLSYPATSGKKGAYEPIPKGEYWINPSELWTCDTIRQLNFMLKGTSCDSSGWGSHRITIHPFPSTNTSGRGGFFIHGGNHQGSAGCINLGLRVADFVKSMQAAIGDDRNCYIPLTVG